MKLDSSISSTPDATVITLRHYH